MTEHLIRLRGGWEWHDHSPEDGPGRRVSLPLVWPSGPMARVFLVRPFQRPPVDLGRELISLRMSAVGGLVAVWLNGHELARPLSGTSELIVPLIEPLPPRNRLVLKVEPGPESAGAPSWGEIALAISPIAI